MGPQQLKRENPIWKFDAQPKIFIFLFAGRCTSFLWTVILFPALVFFSMLASLHPIAAWFERITICNFFHFKIFVFRSNLFLVVFFAIYWAIAQQQHVTFSNPYAYAQKWLIDYAINFESFFLNLLCYIYQSILRKH